MLEVAITSFQIAITVGNRDILLQFVESQRV